MLEQEEKNPSSLIGTNSIEWKDPMFGAAHLKFNLISIATLATFKDIQVEVRFQSKTGTTLSRYKHVVYEFITPNSQVPVRIDGIKPPDGASKVDVAVLRATPTPPTAD
jgi:hypothetical protein